MSLKKLLPLRISFITISLILLSSCAEDTYESIWDREISIADEESSDSLEIKTFNSSSLYDHVIAQGVPAQALEEAFNYYDQNQKNIKNRKYMTIIDFSVHSSEKRKFIINLENGNVDSLLSAHGTGSDPQHTGYAQTFSNVSGSKMTSLGFYLTAEPYYGKYGLSLRLDGLEKRNSLARRRAIVIHGANYVREDRSLIGRSWGCPAVEMPLAESVVRRLQHGSLLYAWHPNFPN